MKIIMHIDFNSYFATVEQQANPRLRGKPIGVTGGDRLERTVLGAASVEAKRLGVKTGMQIWEAKKLCPQIIIVKGDHEKYLSVTTKFLNILKSYTDKLEVFSIDEAFLELVFDPSFWQSANWRSVQNLALDSGVDRRLTPQNDIIYDWAKGIALDIKQKIKSEIGEWMTCSIGISYNKLMAKLAGGLQKPDGLVAIPDTDAAIKVLDTVELDEICGIGSRTKRRLFDMGICNFKTLRRVPKEVLLASFKSYGETLYNMARGLDYSPVVSFYEKEEVKSIGHRHTLDCDISDKEEIRQILLKLAEMVAARLRLKKLAGKTVYCHFRSAFNLSYHNKIFDGGGMQKTICCISDDGFEIFQAAWEVFKQIWDGERIRMVGISVSNLKSKRPSNCLLLPEDKRRELIMEAMDKVNNKFGDFTLQRGTLLKACPLSRKPNSFLSDRRFRFN